jgi:hypothetical protein
LTKKNLTKKKGKKIPKYAKKSPKIPSKEPKWHENEHNNPVKRPKNPERTIFFALAATLSDV